MFKGLIYIKIILLF